MEDRMKSSEEQTALKKPGLIKLTDSSITGLSVNSLALAISQKSS